MQKTIVPLQWFVRIGGLVLVVLGVLFWFGMAYNLAPLHMWLGVLFVLALWILAVLGARKESTRWLALITFVWGAVAAALGVTQQQFLQGDLHWIIEVLHLVVGLVAIGLGDNLAEKLKTKPAAKSKR